MQCSRNRGKKQDKSNQVRSVIETPTILRIGTCRRTCTVFVKTHHVPRNRNRFGGRSLHIISGLR